MTVYLGADHGGFELKEALKVHLDAEGYKVIDCGTDSTQSVDYAPIAEKTCLSVLSDDGSLGRVVGVGLATELADVFLKTEFEGGRHQRRIDQITEIENK